MKDKFEKQIQEMLAKAYRDALRESIKRGIKAKKIKK